MAALTCTVGPSHAIVSDAELRDLAGHIHSEWRDLAVKLGLTESDIFNVEADHNRRHKEVVVQMLLKWKHKNGVAATYRVLVAALNEVERNDLVIPPECVKIFSSCALRVKREKP